MQNRQPMVNQMSGVSNMNLPLRSNVPNQVSPCICVFVLYACIYVSLTLSLISPHLLTPFKYLPSQFGDTEAAVNADRKFLESLVYSLFHYMWVSPFCGSSCREPSMPRCWPSVSASTSATTYANANSSSSNNICTTSVPWWCGLRASTCPAGAPLRRRCPWVAPTPASRRATHSSSPTRRPATVLACPLLLHLLLLIPAPPAPSPPLSPPAIIWLARAWWEM